MANTTADKLQGVLDSKEAIRTAINNKGVTVTKVTLSHHMLIRYLVLVEVEDCLSLDKK